MHQTLPDGTRPALWCNYGWHEPRHVVALSLPNDCGPRELTAAMDFLVAEMAHHDSLNARVQTDIETARMSAQRAAVFRAERAATWEEVSPAAQVTRLEARPVARTPGDRSCVIHPPVVDATETVLPRGVYLSLDPTYHRSAIVWAMSDIGDVLGETRVWGEARLRADVVRAFWDAVERDAAVGREPPWEDRDDDDDPPEAWQQ